MLLKILKWNWDEKWNESEIVFVIISQKSKILSTVVLCLHKENDIKKTVKRKIGKVRVF